MNWDAVGAVAELAGALAVIATLAYLAVQLRQNSALLKASIATASRESTNQLTGLLASDREALRVFYAGLEGRAPLEDLDRQHFDAMVSLYLEALLQSYQQEFEEGLERAHWMLRRPGFIEFWAEYNGLYDQGFTSHINGMMSEQA
jgi:hypothetical protein